MHLATLAVLIAAYRDRLFLLLVVHRVALIPEVTGNTISLLTLDLTARLVGI